MAGKKFPRLPEKLAAWVDSAGRALDDFYFWCQTVDERIRRTAESAATDLAQLAQQVQDIITALTTATYCWTFFIPYVENDTVIIVPKIPFDATLTNFVTDCDSGTCTARPRIDGVNVGTANNAVSTTEVDTAYSTANEIEIGETLDVVISSNSNCVGMRGQITYTRSLLG